MMETDTADMLNEMITSVRKGGRISIVGVYAGYVNHLNIGKQQMRMVQEVVVEGVAACFSIPLAIIRLSASPCKVELPWLRVGQTLPLW